jgi:hypothetical protein
VTVRIDKETRGRFGNKIFHYNAMIQASLILNKNTSCITWKGSEYFDDISNYIPILRGESSIAINGDVLSNIDLEDFKEIGRKYDHIIIDTLALHGTFFKFYKQDLRNFLSLKKEYNFDIPDHVVAIHIRGDDIKGADGNNSKEIHPPEFYIKSINYALSKNKNAKFFIATDDANENYKTYYETYKYLKNKNILFPIKTNSNKKEYITDFSLLCNSNKIIAGSSTFAIAAGIIGKKKTMIHSKEFFEQFLDETCSSWYSNYGANNFFKDAINRKHNNQIYKIEKLI